MLCIRYRGKQ